MFSHARSQMSKVSTWCLFHKIETTLNSLFSESFGTLVNAWEKLKQLSIANVYLWLVFSQLFLFLIWLWTTITTETLKDYVEYFLDLLQGTVCGSIQATDRLMKELRDVYRSDSFKRGKCVVHSTLYVPSTLQVVPQISQGQVGGWTCDNARKLPCTRAFTVGL